MAAQDTKQHMEQLPVEAMPALDACALRALPYASDWQSHMGQALYEVSVTKRRAFSPSL